MTAPICWSTIDDAPDGDDSDDSVDVLADVTVVIDAAPDGEHVDNSTFVLVNSNDVVSKETTEMTAPILWPTWLKPHQAAMIMLRASISWPTRSMPCTTTMMYQKATMARTKMDEMDGE